MARLDKKWLLARTNSEFVDYLAKSLNVSTILSQILINRDIKTPEKARSFFDSTVSLLADPYMLSGMDRAVERINLAVKRSETIFVHGDYDADGTSAAAIMIETLRRLGCAVRYFIPSRFVHGYGFHTAAVELARESGCSLIVTVDCGISSFEAVDSALRYSIDVIITDHHKPAFDELSGQPVLPAAFSVIDPAIMACDNPHSQLTGAGVALMLSMALNRSDIVDVADLLDLATIGTVADVAPLVGENRLIVKDGIKVMAAGKRPGLKALFEIAASANRTIDVELLSYTAIPRINAAGRMADASEVVELFLTDSETDAKRIAGNLDALNFRRQRIEEGVFDSAINQIEIEGFDRAIVIYDEDWHEGVLGIVASKLVDKFGVPAFVLTVKDTVAKGSARGVPEVDIHKVLSECSQYLMQFGGHKQAAGLKLKLDMIPQFIIALNEAIKRTSSDSASQSMIMIDADCSIKDINFKLLNELSMLAPYGYGNPEPFFGIRGLTPYSPKIVGKNHLKLKLGDKGMQFDAIGFDLGDHLPMVLGTGRVDAVVTPTLNEFNGSRTLQLNIKAIRKSAVV
ncbi:MAG: single-stranded-DNA-specific exonuclease RecJ [Nitrospirae bacterium]|nr:single-stranded-DNA-specific exonuclease RecJ [Nitrospirota bacterium]MBF0534235.1 single-stranded-DNA-specific exonuclease RecJ [Nitrospirota bacterium]MBF0615851.1 single-stranded-DNA-specific exonuclease RecJ [Nitrospirota bacterium]